MDKNNLIRVSTFLPKEVVVYLNSLSMKAKATGGAKLSSTMLIRAMVKATMKTKLDVSGIKTEKELVEKIREAMDGDVRSVT